MRRAWPVLVLLTGLAGCSSGPAGILGEWSLVPHDAPSPMVSQRTVFRFEKGNVHYVEHWLAGKQVGVDTNWYRLSPDGTAMDVTSRWLRPDTVHLTIVRCTDTLEMKVAGSPVKMLLARIR